jgi:hypothetical protein
VADDALVDDVVLAVRAGLGDAAGVIDFVSRFEQLRRGADFPNDAGNIPTEDARQLRIRVRPRAHLVIDRIDGDRFDFHQQLAAAGRRLRDLQVDQ